MLLNQRNINRCRCIHLCTVAICIGNDFAVWITILINRLRHICQVKGRICANGFQYIAVYIYLEFYVCSRSHNCFILLIETARRTLNYLPAVCRRFIACIQCTFTLYANDQFHTVYKGHVQITRLIYCNRCHSLFIARVACNCGLIVRIEVRLVVMAQPSCTEYRIRHAGFLCKLQIRQRLSIQHDHAVVMPRLTTACGLEIAADCCFIQRTARNMDMYHMGFLIGRCEGIRILRCRSDNVFVALIIPLEIVLEVGICVCCRCQLRQNIEGFIFCNAQSCFRRIRVCRIERGEFQRHLVILRHDRLALCIDRCRCSFPSSST